MSEKASPESQAEDPYICTGICMVDPDSGYCLGCGRPPLDTPQIVAELVPPSQDPGSKGSDPDTPP